MISKELLNRINELAKKAKNESLTEAELIEQKELREKYLKGFRKNFRAQLERVEIVEPDDPRLKKQ